MSTRISKGGRLIDRGTAQDFTFNGKRMRGLKGDTLASALLANDQLLLGRSFKHHRPRGLVASGAEEPNALVNMGEGGRFEPNQRTTTTELFDGLDAYTIANTGVRYEIGKSSTDYYYVKYAGVDPRERHRGRWRHRRPGLWHQ